MSYEKQNFVSGQTLYASQLNHMEEGIANAQKLTVGTVTTGMLPSASIDESGQLNLVLPKGEKGDIGEPGVQGTKGDTGAKGEKGDVGPTPKLSIGTVESGTTADATLGGTAERPVLNLTLPKGAKGDTGAAGYPATMSIGNVTSGTKASANIRKGVDPGMGGIISGNIFNNYILDLVLPKGEKGDPGQDGLVGGLSEEEKSAVLAVLKVLAQATPEAIPAYNVLAGMWNGELLDENDIRTARLSKATLGKLSLGRS